MDLDVFQSADPKKSNNPVAYSCSKYLDSNIISFEDAEVVFKWKIRKQLI